MARSPLPSCASCVRICALLAIAMSGLSLARCTDSTPVVALTPYTGINIDSASLVSGLGCGTAPGQVYRYVARVDAARDAAATAAGFLAVAVFDCYADGVFENLPASDAGSYDFTLTIYAWDRPSLPPSLDCDGGPCAPPSSDTLATLGPGAKWTTTCTATQEPGAVVYAACAPLHLQPAEVGTDASASADAGTDALE
jgi:hypothetical protein